MRQALSHQSTKNQPYYIPTPEITSAAIDDYDSLYPANYRQPKAYGKSSSGGSSLEDPLQKCPKYNVDEVDENFVATLRKEKAVPSSFDLLLYEWIIDCLEEAAHRLSETVVSSESIERLRDRYSSSFPPEPVINRIIEFWKQRRQQRHTIPYLKHEDLGKLGADPYVCFRRRELKIPRKTRRSDAQIVDRLKKLYLDLSSTKLLLQAAIKRDRYKREALVLEGELFERYRLVDTWRRHNRSGWPTHLPTFKTAAQSLLETKKKKTRHDHTGDMEEAGDRLGYKIAIPVSVLRGSRHARPYYPHDAGRQIQRDLDSILGQGHEIHDNRVAIDDLCPVPEQVTGEIYGPIPWLEGAPMAYRWARGGRLALDGPPPEAFLGQKRSLDFTCSSQVRFLARALAAKDFTQLQTPVGNYNVHAVQTANQILRPMSFQAWIASTAPIMAALSGGSSGGGGSGGGGGGNKKGSSSPKKKRHRTVGTGSVAGTSDPSLGPDSAAPTAPPSSESAVELSKLSGNSQITVKVKSSQPKAARKGTGARFTPHGLAPESGEVSVDVK